MIPWFHGPHEKCSRYLKGAVVHSLGITEYKIYIKFRLKLVYELQ